MTENLQFMMDWTCSFDEEFLKLCCYIHQNLQILPRLIVTEFRKMQTNI